MLIDNRYKIKRLRRQAGGILPLHMLNLIFSEKYDMDELASYYTGISAKGFMMTSKYTIRGKGKIDTTNSNITTLQRKSNQDKLGRGKY